jgi:predicted nucleic acid-binding protein
MSASIFDTHVLVYAFDLHDGKKQKRAQALIRDYGSRGELVISTQVLQEFYVVVTKKLANPVMPVEAAAIVADLAEFPLIQVDKNLISRSIQRHQQGEFSFWDGLIVEAALQANCSLLFSEDMQHGRQMGTLSCQNPFLTRFNPLRGLKKRAQACRSAPLEHREKTNRPPMPGPSLDKIQRISGGCSTVHLHPQWQPAFHPPACMIQEAEMRSSARLRPGSEAP